jgi:UDP-N-acetylglucosamine--N-acetylmuramyl-(pentapeptide) pyrophosphoryl-undecaprenol N-acetylglucosamine transferase
MSVLNKNIKQSHSTPYGAGGRIIIAGGGTGGHIFPAIAIANAIKQLQPDADILFVGAEGKMEMEKVPQAGYPIKGLTIAGFNRSSLIKNIGLPLKVIKSFFQVRTIINQFKPTAVIGVGGYSSFPVLRVAQSKGIPTFIHESNSFAGKANMMLGKKATKIFVATDGMESFFSANKIVVTGNPVRASIAHSEVTQTEALSFFGLQNDIKTVLVVGGSLGAKSINDAIANHIETFAEQGLQLIWQTGKTNSAHYKALANGKPNMWVSEFITQMEMGYAAADIVISRAGAMAVTELCVAGKPSIFVPYPFAAEDHQTANAMALVNKKAALLVKDSDVNEALINAVLELSKNELSQQVLQQNISALAIKNADEVIAKQILYP